ncbi:hypothetical protein AB0J43_16675 [Nonomuraea fuscirosea]
MDETYLKELCEHLASHAPRIGQWSIPLRRPQSGDLGRLTYFSVDDMSLYQAADASGMPFPSSKEDAGRGQMAVEHNALAAVMVVHAHMAVHHPHPHEPGGPDLGTVLGSVPDNHMSAMQADVLMRHIANYRPALFTRILFHLPHAELRTVDLRTVAALAYRFPAA